MRIDPAEKLAFYAAIAKRHPHVRFFSNADATVDESLAAADIVVIRDSGFGSDALVKQRLVIVLDTYGEPLMHGQDLIDLANCPHAVTADELASMTRKMLFDNEYRKRQHSAAEAYTKKHCEYFGEEAAKRIAAMLSRSISPPSQTCVSNKP